MGKKEHIFPQNPDAKWKIELGIDEYNLMKENYLNTIGNLTLSGNNGKLGNKPFLEKREMNVDGKEQGYIFSRLWLNRDLKEKSKWTKRKEINIFDAEDPKFKKLEYVLCFSKSIWLC